MKTLIFIFFTFIALTSNAQTADVNTNTSTDATTDLIVSIPMIGNITFKNCDKKMQEAFEPITVMKIIKIDEAINFYTEKQESMIAASFQGAKKVALPQQ